MKLFISVLISHLFVFVTAFGGMGRRSHHASLQMSSLPKELPGQTLPFGFFDPLHLSDTITEKQLKLWREAELKHGRLCMLAAVGILVAESFDRSPLFGGRIMGPAVYHFQQVNTLMPSFWAVMLFSIAMVELATIKRGWEPANEVTGNTALLRDDYIPGDLNFDPLNFVKDKPKKYTDPLSRGFLRMRNKELNNGRLAMIGVAGMVVQELVDHMKITDHFAQFGLTPGGL